MIGLLGGLAAVPLLPDRNGGSAPVEPARAATPRADPYAESRRSRAILEAQEGRPAPVPAGYERPAEGDAAPATPAGVRVIDGDTFDVGDVRVRLYGVDAVEQSQTCRTEQGVEWNCGAWVAEKVATLFGGRNLDCEAVDTDRYGRVVARCFWDGADIAETLVGTGVVRAYPRYSQDYVALEAEARAQSFGLWSGTALAPEVYRHRIVAAPKLAPTGCAIKGNISKQGRLYHLPGSKWYDKTGIDETSGERWFCSESEATAAGWRKAR
jgi:endonuclease YncB( thermonuclease family)